MNKIQEKKLKAYLNSYAFEKRMKELSKQWKSAELKQTQENYEWWLLNKDNVYS